MPDPVDALTGKLMEARAEIGRLRAELADYKHGAQHEADAGDEARAEIERLRVELRNCQEIRDMAIGRLKSGGLEAEAERLRVALTEIALSEFQDTHAIAAREALASAKPLGNV